MFHFKFVLPRDSIFTYRLQLRRNRRAQVDLRGDNLYETNPQLECCPSHAEYHPRTLAINEEGLVLDVLNNAGFKQYFFETICFPEIKNRPCKFLDSRYKRFSRCQQQYTYQYALAKPYGGLEPFSLSYIRIASGCKCILGRVSVE